MKLNCVLTAVNNKKEYIEFIPIFIKTWNKLYPNIDVKIILIAESIPNEYNCYKDNIILFKPIPNILTSFTAQYIRILYPSILNYENGVLITDIDMIPMNRTYYTENIKNCSNSNFVYYRGNVCFNEKSIAICYNIALPIIWKNIFHINSIEDIRDRLVSVFNNNEIIEGHGNKGWCIDQLHLYKYVMEWNSKTNSLHCLDETITNYRRLDRSLHFKYLMAGNIKMIAAIKNGFFSDYHCLTPHSKYKEYNEAIYNLL